MDYAIYKTDDGKNPRVIRRFTQASCNPCDYRPNTTKTERIRFHIAKL